MTEEKYYCDFCRNEIHKDDPVFATDDNALWYCSVDCFISDNGYQYETLKEAEEALKND
ncbi:hypothetical protein [Lactobacillus jensenii]|uniref:hypothetical protein n=1 Tax=Lactobacillus jensenii TaxID=109790 RepID=UPI001F47C6F9|nr:hypothetical protein [Lactobacillus jensenii]MCF1778177.1 hypothetical protein [Lactobacillus jensenii]